ncbi:Pleckstrin homology domain-containing protein [Mortierella sp. GBAus27b]|nr:Pleckstrin homology domain-containing protein [Mortierella sp. GBAus27b]
MDIYTLLHGAPPIPTFIEIAVPDFDVKVRVPIPEDSETETDMDDDSSEDNQSTKDLGLSSSLPLHGPQYTATTVESGSGASTSSNAVFRTARTSFPARMATKTFYLTDDKAKPTLVAPDEVTPKLLRSHVLHLLKDVSDWTEVVKTWLDPTQHGDVALCWKRYDRIEWIYWNDRVLAETDSIHLRKDHIGFADGSEWSGRMDETVVGPQVLDKTHRLELRPITHYPTKARQPGPHGVELQEPDPIEGYLVRVSTFSGNPIRRFRRLYLTSHDHLLIYTIPSQSNSPTMQHAGSIDPSALMFSITPHRSVNPDHKDIAQSRSVRRLKAQVRAARGFLDMTKIESVRVLSVREWEAVRHLSYARKDEWCDKKETKREKLGKAVQRVAEAAQDNHQQTQQQQAPTVIVRNEADNYFFPNILTEPVESSQEQTQGSSSQQQQEQQEQQEQEQGVTADRINGHPLAASEPLNNSLGRKSATHGNTGKGGSFKEGIVRSATFVADFLLHNDQGQEEEEEDCDSNVIEIQMKDGPCVRFRAYSAEAAHLWSDQLEKLAEYWTLRKHLDVKDHMCVAQANYQLASSLDDDEVQVGTGKAIQEWDNDRAMVSPQVWNWCVVNGCRSITKSGMVYFKPKLYSPFQKMFLVLTEGYLMLFHPHRRSKTSGRLIPTTVSKLYAIHSLTDVYLYSGRFSDEDTYHGTNDESERLPRFFPDGLIVDDPDDDCTFSIWRGQRRTMFSRKGSTLMTMSAREVGGSSKIFGKDGLLSSMVKEGVVYGSAAQSCSVFRARSRPDLEEWVYAINTEIERCVRGERRRVRTTGHL